MAKADAVLLTQAQYARSRKERGLPGGSRESVRKAVDEGRISSFGDEKRVSLELADSQWAANTRARVGQGAAGTGAPVDSPGPDLLSAAQGEHTAPAARSGGDANYQQLRSRREEADAQIAEMNAAKMRGAMLMRDDVDRAMFEIGRELRDRLTACGRRIASEVSSLATAEECEGVIDREHRIVLELLVTHLREKIGAPPKAAA